MKIWLNSLYNQEKPKEPDCFVCKKPLSRKESRFTRAVDDTEGPLKTYVSYHEACDAFYHLAKWLEANHD